MSTEQKSLPAEAKAKVGSAKESAQITFDQFDALYRAHLGDPDQPSCYTAYIRAEDDVVQQYGERRYKNYPSYVSARTNRRAREKEAGATTNTTGKIPIKCHICTAELFTVPRGDLRTIIPHICDGCRDEIRKLIFT